MLQLPLPSAIKAYIILSLWTTTILKHQINYNCSKRFVFSSLLYFNMSVSCTRPLPDFFFRLQLNQIRFNIAATCWCLMNSRAVSRGFSLSPATWCPERKKKKFASRDLYRAHSSSSVQRLCNFIHSHYLFWLLRSSSIHRPIVVVKLYLYQLLHNFSCLSPLSYSLSGSSSLALSVPMDMGKRRCTVFRWFV